MNIFRFECRRYLVSTFIWAFSLMIFGAVCIQLFVSFTADMSMFDKMLNAYSPQMLKALGAGLKTIRTLPGFYSFCFMYVLAAAAFQATYLGIHVMGKEMAGKSADFLFTKPVRRTRILTCKLMSSLVCLLIVNVIYGSGTYLSAVMTNLTFQGKDLLMINVSMFLTQLLFFSLGFLLGCCLHKVKSPLTLTAGIVCAFFLLQMVVNLEPQGWLSYLSFLSYLSSDYLLAHGSWETVKLLLLLGLCIAFLCSGYIIFERRDIQAL